MLDSFLKVACSRSQKATDQARLVDRMRELPEEVLLKIASGEEKLAYIGGPLGCGIDGGTWLDRFKGTPLFPQAIELEKQDLQAQMAEQAAYREDDAKRSTRSAARDELSVQRKLLELQLAEHELGGGGEAQPFAGKETPEEEALEHGAGSPEEAAAAEKQQAAPVQVETKAPPAPSKEASALRFAYAKMKMAAPLPVDIGAWGGGGLGALSAPAVLAHQGINTDPEAPMMSGRSLASGLAAGVGTVGGGAAGGALGALGSRLPGVAGKIAPIAGIIGGAGLGAGLGAYLVPNDDQVLAKKRRAEQSTKDELLQLPESDQQLPPQVQAEQKTAAFRKIAIGLGGLGTAIGGGAKAVGKGAVGAFQTSRAFGGGMGDALRAAGGSIANKAPGALSTMGKAVTSYAKANPMQAAGIAGGAGLLAGHALTSKQQAN